MKVLSILSFILVANLGISAEVKDHCAGLNSVKANLQQAYLGNYDHARQTSCY